MQSEYDWNLFPKYTLSVSDLLVPAEIMTFFKNRQIDKYVYCIMFKGIVIKFGMSAPKSSSREWGERVYRQIGHCYTWGDGIRLDGSSGADWLVIERDVKQMYGINITHTDLKIIIWDVTNYKFKSFSPFNEVEAMESELINNYVTQFGQTPIGNINDEANKRNRTYVSKEQFESVFTIDNDSIFVEQ
jgi:hypothetical protein